MKVIDIFIREELDSFPFNKEQAAEFMAYIMKYKQDASIPYSEEFLIRSVLHYLENNSGNTKEEVFNKTFMGA